MVSRGRGPRGEGGVAPFKSISFIGMSRFSVLPRVWVGFDQAKTKQTLGLRP